MSHAQRAVQAAHASIEASNAFDLGNLPDHPYLVVLAARSSSKLERVARHLQDSGVQFTKWCDADFDEPLTAIATEPIHGDDPRREFLRKYQLLGCQEEVSPV